MRLGPDLFMSVSLLYVVYSGDGSRLGDGDGDMRAERRGTTALRRM